MRLLLDTHVLLWWLAGTGRVTARERHAISDPANQVFVSAATSWEISIKAAAGRLRVPDHLELRVREVGFDFLPITFADGLAAGSLPRHHTDPFDRMLIAQAAENQLMLVTHDRQFETYGVPIFSL